MNFLRPKGPDSGAEEPPAAPRAALQRTSWIDRHRKSILYLLETKPTLILHGLAGSGLSRLVPPLLVQGGWPTVVCAVPCDVTVPEQGADGTGLRRVSAETLARSLLDREPLVDVSVVVLEIPERPPSPFIAVLLGGLQRLQRQRPKLGIVVITSNPATAERIAASFGEGAGLLALNPPVFAVEAAFLRSPCRDVVDAAAQAVLQVARQRSDSGPGGILVWAASARDAKAVEALVLDARRAPALAPVLVPGRTNEWEARDANAISVVIVDASAPDSATAAVAAAIRYQVSTVIDSGLAERLVWDSATGTDPRRILPIGDSEARNRALVAGLCANGLVIRLWTAETSLAPAGTSGMFTGDWSGALLLAAALKLKVSLLEIPSALPGSLAQCALAELWSLELVDANGICNGSLGAKAAILPLPPRLAVAVARSVDGSCTGEVVSAAAMIVGGGGSLKHYFGQQNGDAAPAHADFAASQSDLLTLVNLLAAFAGVKRRGGASQARRFCAAQRVHYGRLEAALAFRAEVAKAVTHAFGVSVPEADAGASLEPAERAERASEAQQALVAGFAALAARLYDPTEGTYRSIVSRTGGGRPADLRVHPDSILAGCTSTELPLVVVCANVGLSDGPFLYMRGIQAVCDASWLSDGASRLFSVAFEPEGRSAGSAVDSIKAPDETVPQRTSEAVLAAVQASAAQSVPRQCGSKDFSRYL